MKSFLIGGTFLLHVRLWDRQGEGVWSTETSFGFLYPSSAFRRVWPASYPKKNFVRGEGGLFTGFWRNLIFGHEK